MARQSLNGVRMHVIVPIPQRNALQALSRKTGMTTAEHIRRALDLYIEHTNERLAEPGAKKSPQNRGLKEG